MSDREYTMPQKYRSHYKSPKQSLYPEEAAQHADVESQMQSHGPTVVFTTRVGRPPNKAFFTLQRVFHDESQIRKDASDV
jgi:hypothetical protein